MSSDVVISVKNISKCYQIYNCPQDRLKQSIFKTRQYYKEFWALKNVDLEVKKGETIGIIGRNGSGKSTLLQIIAGTLQPTEGEVEVKGRVAALLELGSGFNPEFTGRENVYMNGSILGLKREEIDAIYDEIVSFADIGDHIDQPIKTYSSGMVVRLAFAVQAMVPKEVLIVDEALAVGDELFQRKCFTKIEEFKENGGTILFVSHDGASVVQLCDRAMLLDDGEPLIIGKSKKVVNLYQKLVYSPADKRLRMREEIKSLYENEQNVSLETNQLSIPYVGTTIADSKNMVEKNTVKEAMYDPYLIPHETLQYESRGARIFDPEITTLSGKKVNLLIGGQRYVWRYYVKFEIHCQNVRFGMLIKTPNGLEIGGAVSSRIGQGIPSVYPGYVAKVEFTFVPRLNTGTYFLNGGVLGLTDDGEVYLDRGIDLAAFKILYNEGYLGTALVDFEVVPSVYERID